MSELKERITQLLTEAHRESRKLIIDAIVEAVAGEEKRNWVMLDKKDIDINTVEITLEAEGLIRGRDYKIANVMQDKFSLVFFTKY